LSFVWQCISADAATALHHQRNGLQEKCVTVPPLDIRYNSLYQRKKEQPQFGRQIYDIDAQSEKAVMQQVEVRDHGSPFNSRVSDERSSSGRAANHMTATGHGISTVPCRGCLKKFHTQSAANEHMAATGHGIPTVPCRGCLKKFHTQSAANEHMASTGHGIPTVLCKRCAKKFYTQSAANEHMIAVRH
jgi:hypothetical protein